MDRKFNVGDKVRCVDAHHELVKGQEYIITKVDDHPQDPIVHLNGIKERYYHRRFELVTPAKNKKKKLPKRTGWQVGDLAFWVDALGMAITTHTYEIKAVDNEKQKLWLKGYEYPMDEGYDFKHLTPVVPFKIKQKTYKELYAGAKNLNIPNRSSMRVKELALAIEEFLLKGRPTLGKELAGKITHNSCCHFAREYAGGVRSYSPDQPCHASLKYNHERECISVVEHIAKHHEHHSNPESYLKFVDYILNRSPWSNTFLTKSTEEALKDGVYSDVSAPKSRVCCSLIALRQGSEFPAKLSVFDWFKSEGFSENVSWFMAQGVYLENGNFFSRRISGGHDVFTNTHCLEDVVKFFKTGWHMKPDGPYKTTDGYLIFDSIGRFISRERTLQNFFDAELGFEQVGGWGLNPKPIPKERVLALAKKVSGMID